jgi:flagellar basal-body rod protein FlgB
MDMLIRMVESGFMKFDRLDEEKDGALPYIERGSVWIKRCGPTMDLITSLTSQVMNKALDGLSKRHKAIASNLANVDTPGYQRRDVSFEGALQQAITETKSRLNPTERRPASNDIPLAMQATDPRHIAIGHLASSVNDVQPEDITSEDVQFRNDGNAVDVETEMVQLAKNTQRFTALSNLQGRSIRMMHSVINGGGS